MEEVENRKPIKYQIKHLWGQQKEIIRLVASGLYTQKEVAEMVGVSANTVWTIVNSELGRQMLSMLDGASDLETIDLMARLKMLAPLALRVQEEMLFDEGTPLPLKDKIADRILDRAGYAPISKNLNLNLNKGLTREDIDAIKKRADEIRSLTAKETQP